MYVRFLRFLRKSFYSYFIVTIMKNQYNLAEFSPVFSCETGSEETNITCHVSEFIILLVFTCENKH